MNGIIDVTIFMFRVPVRTLYNVFPNGHIEVVKMSLSARFLLTVGKVNEKQLAAQLWFWTLGNDKPDGNIK